MLFLTTEHPQLGQGGSRLSDLSQMSLLPAPPGGDILSPHDEPLHSDTNQTPSTDQLCPFDMMLT